MDGRLQRWQRTHRSLVTAAIELVVEMQELPSAQAIAERAGITKRTVFDHFPDLETLFSDAADHQQHRSWSMLSRPDLAKPFGERLAVAVEQRARLFEEIGPVRRVAARFEKDHRALRELMGNSRSALRQHFAQHIAPELEVLEPDVGEGVQALATFEMWDLLRHQQSLTFSAAAAAVQSTIEAAVAAARVKES